MFSLSAATPPAASSDFAKDVTLSNFVAEVIEASKTSLVLVNFWMPGEPSCKQLMTVLEKLTREAKGVVKLARADIDKNMQIAQQMGVQSVPSVFAFHAGRPIDAFAGAMPEAEVKKWLDHLLKQTGTGAVVDDDKPNLDLALGQAADCLAEKDIDTARAIYIDILDMEPTNAASYAGLVRCLIDEGKIPEARQKLDAATPEIAKDKAIGPVRAALELLEQAGQNGGQVAELESKLAQDPADHQARFDLALAYYAAGKREEAVDQLLEIVKRARNWNEDAARKQLVKFFEAFGIMDPLTIAARKRLSSLMFS